MCRLFLCVVLALLPFLPSRAQIRTDRVLSMGRNALYYEDYVVALRYFTMCVEAKPYLGEPYYYRAMAKFYLGDYTGADRDATEALRLNPYIDKLLPLRAICRVNLGRYAEAEADYAAIVDRRADDHQSWHNLLMCQLEQQLGERADSTLSRYRLTNPPAERLASLTHLIADHRLGIDTTDHYERGEFATKADRGEAPTLQPLYALNFYPSTSLTTAYEAYYAPLEVLNNQGLFAGRLQLTNSEGYVSEQAIHLHQTDIRLLSERIEQMPHYALLHLRRATDYYHTLDFEHCIADLDTSIALDSLNYLAYFLRAQARNALMLSSHGGQSAEQLPSSEQRIAYGHIIDDLKRAISVEPQFPYAHYNLGTVYALLHDYDQADHYLSEALRLDTHLPSAYYNRGLVRLRNNQRQAALEDLSQAAQNGIYAVYEFFLGKK